MCNLTQIQKEYVLDALNYLVTNKETFTGHDVHVVTKKHAEDCLYTYTAPSFETSAYVRELFNGHAPLFQGYCCYPIDDGPLLFFPAPKKVLLKEQSIRRAIDKARDKALKQTIKDIDS